MMQFVLMDLHLDFITEKVTDFSCYIINVHALLLSPPIPPCTGSGSGATKLIIHLEGGGVCEDEEDCLKRSRTDLGSSKHWKQTAEFGGFLSDSELFNKHFYNWNVVFVNYCDGGIYSGYV